MAYLGRADDAVKAVVDRASHHDTGSRFPAFWGPNFDWVPDQDHGGVLLKAVQAMLLQSDGDRIFVLPAWPESWDVEFKLRAPRNTTVECNYQNGRIVQLTVLPKERAKDVVLVPLASKSVSQEVKGVVHEY